MLSVLFFDCETSGLYRPALDPDHPSQPHLVQLTTKLVRWHDRKKMGGSSWLIRPDGWTVEPEAFAVHGISDKDCYQFGVPVAKALLDLQAACKLAEIVVAHNVQFDRAVILAAILRTQTPTAWWDRMARSFRCSMERATDIVKLPGQFGTFKYPSLAEAHDYFFPNLAPYKTIHAGEEDTEACERLWFAMDDMESNHGNEDISPGDGVRPVDGTQAAPNN